VVTSVGKATSFGAGLDAGVLYMPTDAVTIGATLRDLTTTYLAWSNGSREHIDPWLDTGVSFNFYPAPRHAITAAMDLGWNFENRKLDSELQFCSVTADIRTGISTGISTVALRTGNGKGPHVRGGLRTSRSAWTTRPRCTATSAATTASSDDATERAPDLAQVNW
jgi:hypothetical protein